MRTSRVRRLTAALLVSAFAVCALTLSTTARAAEEKKKADATGTWKWSQPGRDGGEAREFTLKLKQDGEKLTGVVLGRQGNETEISEGKVKGNELTFTVTREFNGNKFTQNYSGKIEGDTIKGKIDSTGRDGQSRTREWEAKRAKDEKKPDQA